MASILRAFSVSSVRAPFWLHFQNRLLTITTYDKLMNRAFTYPEMQPGHKCSYAKLTTPRGSKRKLHSCSFGADKMCTTSRKYLMHPALTITALWTHQMCSWWDSTLNITTLVLSLLTRAHYAYTYWANIERSPRQPDVWEAGKGTETPPPSFATFSFHTVTY